MSTHRFWFRRGVPLLSAAVAVLAVGCGGRTLGGGFSRMDAAVQRDAAVVSVDAAPDAGPQSCVDLNEPACRADPVCSPGCAGMCDCTCPGPQGAEGCGCAECEASCFVFTQCFDGTPCGPDLICDPASEVCVIWRDWGETYSCAPFPADCVYQNDCGCLESRVCNDMYDFCIDEPAHNTVACECSAC